MSDTATIQERRDFGIIFIHSSLDDCGLSANEFRIYAHIARRAGSNNKAWPGIDSIAEVCRMSKNTVTECIRQLEARAMLSVSRKVGQASVYSLTPEHEWQVYRPNLSNGASQTEERYRPNLSNVSVSIEGNPEKEIQGNGHSEEKGDEENLPLFPDLEPTHPAVDVSKQVIQHVAEKRADMDGEANRIYDAYPRKVGRGEAIPEIKKALKKHAFTFLLEKTERYAICRMGKNPDFTWHAKTFFRGEHYLDDEGQWTTTGAAAYQRQNSYPTSGEKPKAKIYLSGDERRRIRQEQAEARP